MKLIEIIYLATSVLSIVIFSVFRYKSDRREYAERQKIYFERNLGRAENRMNLWLKERKHLGNHHPDFQKILKATIFWQKQLMYFEGQPTKEDLAYLQDLMAQELPMKHNRDD